MSENKNANFEAEISQMNCRLKALAEQNEDLLGDQERKEENARKKDEFVEKLKTASFQLGWSGYCGVEWVGWSLIWKCFFEVLNF